MIARAFLSAGLQLYSCALRPDHAGCPEGWYLASGIRLSGRFECLPSPPRDEYDCTADPVCPQPAGEEIGVAAQIVCTSGHVPVVVSERVVSCEARH